MRPYEKIIDRWGPPGRNTILFCLALVLFHITGPAFENHIQESQRLLAAGNMEGAEREAKLALRDSATHALALAMLGTIRLQQNRNNEGIDYLKKAVRMDPRLVGARLNLGDAYTRVGKIKEARDAYDQALRLRPDNTTARLDLAQLEASAGDYRASLEVAEPILPLLHKSAEAILVLATDYSGLQKKELMGPLVADWRSLREVPEPLCLSFAALLAENDLLPGAIDVLNRCANNQKGLSFELSATLGGLYLRSGDTKLASDHYEAALRLRPGCVPCLQGLASIADKQGESEKALAYLIRARRLQPDDPSVLFDFGKVCLQRNLFEDALSSLQRAVALRPDNDHYRYVLASGYVSTAHYAKARVLLESLLKKHPNDSVLHYALGAVLYLQGDFDAAEISLQKSIDLNADQVGAYYYLGLTAEKKRDNERAEHIFDDLLKRHPEHIPSYVGRGTVLVALKKYTEA